MPTLPHSSHLPVPRRPAVGRASLATLSLSIAATSAGAQTSVVPPSRAATLAPTVEQWSLGDGLAQPGAFGGADVVVREVSAVTVPFGVAVPLGGRWTADVGGVWSAGRVTLAGTDPTLGMREYSLDGFGTVAARLVGNLVGDHVLLTLGVSAPTGATELDDEQLAAVRVLAAPALRLAGTAAGSGLSATGGLVLARQAGDWGLALGLGYEVRGRYQPVAALGAGLPAADFDPGDALRVTLGADRLLGEHALTLRSTVERSTQDRLTQPAAGQGAPAVVGVQLRPTVLTEAQLALGTRRLRDAALGVRHRYRGGYELDGALVDGSTGHEVDGQATATLPVGGRVGLVLGATGRYHTGLRVDSSLATAAVRAVGASVGLRVPLGAGELRPTIGAQTATIDAADASSARGLTAGVTFVARF